jgi:predicted hydrocarbon binding protein
MKKASRWYDKNPKLSRYINLLLDYPDDFQVTLSEGIAFFIEKEYKDRGYLTDLKSLGKEKVMALYKSKGRKRKYDKNPTVHKAMTYLFILPHEEQEYVMDTFANLFEFVESYLVQCRNRNETPTLSHLRELTKIYITVDQEAAGKYLDVIAEGTVKPEISPPASKMATFLTDDEDEGMVIRLRNEPL